MTHLNLQEVSIGPIFGRDWTEIYLTLSLVFVRQKSRPIRTYKRPLFDHLWGILDGKMFKVIPEVHWTTSRPLWTYMRRLLFSIFFAEMGRPRGDNFAFLDVLVDYFILYLQKYVVHTKVCHKVCLCVTY